MSTPKKKGRLDFDTPVKSTPAKSSPPARSSATSPATPPTTSSRPSASRSRQRADEPEQEPAKDPFAYRQEQRCVYFSRELHEEAKVLAAKMKITLREYIEGLIRADLNAKGIFTKGGT